MPVLSFKLTCSKPARACRQRYANHKKAHAQKKLHH